jgi:hypothetical protein
MPNQFLEAQDYASSGIRRDVDFVASAEAVRPMLGVSPDNVARGGRRNGKGAMRPS